MTDLRAVSEPARVAAVDEGITAEELQLAARNHGLPLEALSFDVTPAGLHYLLIHYDVPAIDPAGFRLVVDGLVDTPLSLDLDAIRRRPRASAVVTLECAGNGRARLLPRPISQPWLVEAVGTARWTGISLAALLREAGVRDGAAEVVFTGADHGVERGVEQDYQRSLTVADCLREDVLLAYEMNGAPLPPQHGFPLRLLVPGWYGMAQVKWLTGITVVAEPFDGFQMQAYRLRQRPDDEGVPLTRMEPRALIRPPGFPDFMSRTRVVRPGRTVLDGRAWSGWAPVTAVEVSVDGGVSWAAAELEPESEPAAGPEAAESEAAAGPGRWVRWTLPWEAVAGRHLLAVRASDASGRSQSVDAGWNRGGFANNVVQRVPVLVTA